MTKRIASAEDLGENAAFRVERNAASAAFFDAAGEGTLLIRVCPECDRLYAPHHKRCVDGYELAWRAASGSAQLVTWAVDHAPPVSPELSSIDGGPPVIGIVELDEGPWMYTALPGVAPEALREGMAMHVRFLPLGGAEPVPVFTPAATGPDSKEAR